MGNNSLYTYMEGKLKPEVPKWNPHDAHIIEVIRTALREARGRVADLEKMLEDAEHGS